MKTILLAVVMLVSLSACGTTRTLSDGEDSISQDLSEKGSYCTALPRVYSGVSYDVCQIHSRPTGPVPDIIDAVYLVDILFSAATDTLVLPYSIYRQAKDGSIELQK